MKKTILMAITAQFGLNAFFGGPVLATPKTGLADMTRLAAGEGMVLLKNEHQTLPLRSEQTVSLFGRVQIDYFACGYGSGGGVQTPYVINILDALRRHPAIHINESLAAVYESWCRRNPPDNGSWGNWPLNHPEMPLDDHVVENAAAVSDVAVVVIGRSAGEDRDARLEPGSYYLTESEKEMLEKVDRKFSHVVVLLNSGSIIDMSWVDDYDHLDSVLCIWQGGMKGGTAVADVLSGDVVPSGKLAATVAKRYEDFPTAGKSGGEKIFGGWNFSNYVEDIFVGYRYFETFAKDAVRYPFGYGMSYTDFAIKTTGVSESDGLISVHVSVKNMGKVYSGKEVVQVYYGAPQGRLGKAAKSLAAYAKTRLLAPGESESIRLSFKVDDMASYDDAGKTGHKSAYVMEAGEYPVYVGNSVRSAEKKGMHVEARLRVVRPLSEVAAVPAGHGFMRLHAASDRHGNLSPVYEAVPTRSIHLADRIKANRPKAIKPTKGRGIQLADVFSGKAPMKKFVAQLSVEELGALCRGDYHMGSGLGPSGNASVFGGVLPSLRDKGVVPVSTVDGPSGVRLTATTSLLPVGTVLACSWNDRLVEGLYALVGQEMLLNKADVLLAPGMNIQRDPLCGRNFEYFSEDPLLTGQMGANVVRGLQSQGVSATPKHLGLNNQETRRNVHDSRCSERALREIYTKGFEICVKTAAPQNLMASYNKINGVYSHYNYDLFTTLLRDEWGYDGVVMTDWWIKPGTSPDNEHIFDNAYRVQAQVDVLMPGEGPQNGAADSSLLTSYESGRGITLGELQRSAVNVLNYVMKSPAFRTANAVRLFFGKPRHRWFGIEQDAVSTPRLAALSIGGNALAGFDPLVLDYEIYTPRGASFPEWKATAAEGCRMEITEPCAESPVVLIRVSNGRAQSLYRIFFTDAPGLEPVAEHPVYARITNLFINGEELPQFYPGELEYHVHVPDIAAAVITAEVPDEVTYSVTRRPPGDHVVVRAESPHQAMEYSLFLTQGKAEAQPCYKSIHIPASGSARVEAEDYIYKSEGISTQACEDAGGGLNVGWTAPGSCLIYHILVKQAGTYAVSPRIASNAAALTQLSYNLEVDGNVVASFLHGGTGGWQSWKSIPPKRVYLDAGSHKLRLYFVTPDVNLNYLEFRRAAD